MQIIIRNRKRLKGGCFGITRTLSRQRLVIEMSLERNKSIAEYSSTLLHELLHAWLAVIKSYGVVISNRKEHPFIYKVESKIVNLLKILKRG